MIFFFNLLYLFISLWILSIFGDYGDMTSWYQARHMELFHWSLLFGAAACAAIWLGVKDDDAMLRGYGLVFLGLNLYTRFFEWFWDSLNKGLFFICSRTVSSLGSTIDPVVLILNFMSVTLLPD